MNNKLPAIPYEVLWKYNNFPGCKYAVVLVRNYVWAQGQCFQYLEAVLHAEREQRTLH